MASIICDWIDGQASRSRSRRPGQAIVQARAGYGQECSAFRASRSQSKDPPNQVDIPHIDQCTRFFHHVSPFIAHIQHTTRVSPGRHCQEQLSLASTLLDRLGKQLFHDATMLNILFHANRLLTYFFYADRRVIPRLQRGFSPFHAHSILRLQ